MRPFPKEVGQLRPSEPWEPPPPHLLATTGKKGKGGKGEKGKRKEGQGKDGKGIGKEDWPRALPVGAAETVPRGAKPAAAKSRPKLQAFQPAPTTPPTAPKGMAAPADDAAGPSIGDEEAARLLHRLEGDVNEQLQQEQQLREQQQRQQREEQQQQQLLRQQMQQAALQQKQGQAASSGSKSARTGASSSQDKVVLNAKEEAHEDSDAGEDEDQHVLVCVFVLVCVYSAARCLTV